jgi:hypothetical protein
MSGACCMSIEKEERGEKEKKNSSSVAINISSCLASSTLVKHKIGLMEEEVEDQRSNLHKCNYARFIRYHFCRTRLFRARRAQREVNINKQVRQKWLHKMSVIQYFFYFSPILKIHLKKSSKHNARKIIFGKYKGW